MFGLIFDQSNVGRFVGALIVSVGLTGCAEVSMEVHVLGEDSIRATTVKSMNRDVYDVSQIQNETGFCDDGQIELTDIAAICTVVMEGDFASLSIPSPDGSPQPSVVLIDANLVRVTFPTADLENDFGASTGSLDEQEKQIIAMFAGRSITLTVTGGEIVETNMTLAKDKQSASLEISLTALFAGETDLPTESFATIKLP